MCKSVLVMGGSYFSGKRIVETLINADYQVYILNRGTRPINNTKIHQLICDRNDKEGMKRVLAGHVFDIVIDMSGFNKDQVEILYNSLQIANLNQYVFISSSAVYDIDNCEIPYTETDELAENKYWTFYGRDKIEAESFLISKFQDSDTNLVILRPPYTYGENNYAQRESFIFDHIVNNKPILVPNNGETKLQFIYTTDLANTILKLLAIELDTINIFNVGNKKAVSIKEWIQCCEKVVGKTAQIIEYDYQKYGRNVREFFPFFNYDNVLDVTRINKIYDIETDFIEGLKKAFEWYCDNKANIMFKEKVAKNEQEILKELGKLC